MLGLEPSVLTLLRSNIVTLTVKKPDGLMYLPAVHKLRSDIEYGAFVVFITLLVYSDCRYNKTKKSEVPARYQLFKRHILAFE